MTCEIPEIKGKYIGDYLNFDDHAENLKKSNY